MIASFKNDRHAGLEVVTLDCEPLAQKPDPVNSTILGAAAEHYVMCQLLRRGLIAALAPAGVPNADIVLSDQLGSKLAAIQVKARRAIGSDGGWHMKAKHDTIASNSLFYCFVDFGKEIINSPRCWVLPSVEVANAVSEYYQAWLQAPGKSGKQHNETKMRRFLPDYSPLVPHRSQGWLDRYDGAWDRLVGA